MSLNWDTTEIEGYRESVYFQEQGAHAVTACIVHRMMHTGIGWQLTEDNAAEFYARCKLADLLAGELLFINGKAHEITPKFIKDHIGLRVNVSPETRTSFIKRYADISFDEWIYKYNKDGKGVQQD